MDIYNLKAGTSPLIISVPHAGTFVPEDIKKYFTAIARTLPDTDWHVDQLYNDFANANNATIVKANYSRYVIDLNRPSNDEPLYPGQTKIPLCPEETFDGQALYEDTSDMTGRIEKYWQPYHDELARQIERVKGIHGYAILYDAHSICQIVPRLFEGNLPDLNLGTVNGISCDKGMAKAAFEVAQDSSYSAVLNGRFVGGYITRHYGDPEGNVHALQMELVRGNYMNEDGFVYDEARAAQLKPVLERVLHAITNNFDAGIKPKPV